MTSNLPGAKLFVDRRRAGRHAPDGAAQGRAHARSCAATLAAPMPITMTAGAQVSQHIEPPKTASTSGQLQVWTEPAGARHHRRHAARHVAGHGRRSAPGEHAGCSKAIAARSSRSSPSRPDHRVADGLLSRLTARRSGLDVDHRAGRRVPRTSGSSARARAIALVGGRHDPRSPRRSVARRAPSGAPGKVTPIKIDFEGTIALNAVPGPRSGSRRESRRHAHRQPLAHHRRARNRLSPSEGERATRRRSRSIRRRASAST